MVGKRSVDVEAQSRGVTGKPVEEARSHQAAHPTASIEDESKRSDDARVDEREHMLDVVVEE